jgi:segregation and condensation protein B
MNDELLPELNLDLPALLEAILFASSSATTVTQLAAALDLPVEEVESGLIDLEAHYLAGEPGRGLRLQRFKGRIQLTTVPEAAPFIEKYLGLEAGSRLSRAALEALAVVAFQQPVTRPQVDAIRGVNSDGVIKNLLGKGLITELGRSEAVGRPILYGTTPEFLQYFGLDSLESLPPLKLEPDSGDSD